MEFMLILTWFSDIEQTLLEIHLEFPGRKFHRGKTSSLSLRPWDGCGWKSESEMIEGVFFSMEEIRHHLSWVVYLPGFLGFS